MRHARLGDVVTSMKNGLYKPASNYADDGMPCLRMYNIEAGSIVWRDIKRMRISEAEYEEYGLHEGDLLVNRVNSRELVGKTACIPPSLGPSVFESKNIRVRLDQTKALPKFINYQLLAQGRRYFAGNAQQVVGMASISQKQLADFPIILTDFDEQRRIVAEIEKQFSRLDEAVANLKRVKANLKRYRGAALHEAVAAGLGGDSGSWRTVVLGQVATSIRNGVSKKPDAESGTPILRISAVRPLELNVADVRFLSGASQEYEPFWLRANDVLFTRYNGSRGLVGVCAEVPAGLRYTVYPDKLIRVRLDGDVLLPAFLVIAASTGEARAFIESRTRTTAGQAGISGADLKSLPLRLPPLPEQHRIVAEVDRRLSIVREVETEVDSNLKRAQSLRQAVLARAFSGLGAGAAGA